MPEPRVWQVPPALDHTVADAHPHDRGDARVAGCVAVHLRYAGKRRPEHVPDCVHADAEHRANAWLLARPELALQSAVNHLGDCPMPNAGHVVALRSRIVIHPLGPEGRIRKSGNDAAVCDWRAVAIVFRDERREPWERDETREAGVVPQVVTEPQRRVVVESAIDGVGITDELRDDGAGPDVRWLHGPRRCCALDFATG